MKTVVRGRNVEITDELRDHVERKISRLDRVAHGVGEAGVEVIAHASHASDHAHVVEVTLRFGGETVRSSSDGPTPHAALDAVLDKLERQIVRHNQRPRARDRDPGGDMAGVAPGAGRDRGSDDGTPAVVKVKRFDMEPMFEEDALARMDELQHSFFVFLNAESNAICVLYRRRDGAYGLIEPVVRR